MIAKRNFRNIETDALRSDIKSACAVIIYSTSIGIGDAPWRNVRVRENTPNPEYDSDIDDARENHKITKTALFKANVAN